MWAYAYTMYMSFTSQCYMHSPTIDTIVLVSIVFRCSLHNYNDSSMCYNQLHVDELSDTCWSRVWGLAVVGD